MTKLLSFQDFHSDPAWITESEADTDRLCEVAIQEKIDGFTCAGDYFNKAVMATSQNKWDRMLRNARKLQAIAPVYFVQGTPSHDPDGIYESLIDIGWTEITIGKSATVGDVLICGLPEITPAMIMAQNPDLSKQDAIARQYDLIDKVIDNYYVPLVTAHNGSVHFMGHGHIANSKFREDQKPRTSDFMFTENMLDRIGADYVQFGHLHLPQKYYGGCAHLTWGDIGFVPGFDVITYYEHEQPSEDPLDFIGSETIWQTQKSRFNFNKPERQKITISDFSALPDWHNSSVQAKYAATDLWIEVKCDRAFADQFDIAGSLKEIQDKIAIGPLSKITLDIQHEEHTRVDVDEYEACATLEDLYKIFDPTVAGSTLIKVKEAEEATGQADQVVKSQTIDLRSVYLKGSKAGMENGVEEIEVDFSEFKTGANLLTGPNGTGKSFFLGFCTPYSQHIPTGSDLKALFDLKDSQVIRKFSVNGQTVTQKIVIDPTLASPSAKYYMDIDGTACPGVTGNKAPFDTAVQEMFGSLKMFMACVFKGQKESKEFPSLENSKESDLRQIFTELSGIDRTPLKDYAHQKSGELKRGIELDAREIETLEGMVVSEVELQLRAEEIHKEMETNKLNSSTLSTKLTTVKKALSAIEADKQGNNSVDDQIASRRPVYQNLSTETLFIENKISGIKSQTKNLDEVMTELDDLISSREKHSTLSEKYFHDTNIFNTSISEYNQKKKSVDENLQEIQDRAEEKKRIIAKHGGEIQHRTTQIKGYEDSVILINKPCEHCGKLSSTSSGEIRGYDIKIEENKRIIQIVSEKILEMEAAVKTEGDNYRRVRASIGPYPSTPDDLILLKSRYDSEKPNTARITELEALLKAAETSTQKITELEAELKQKSDRMTEIDQEIQGLQGKLIPISDKKYSDLQQKHGDINHQVINLTTEIGRLTAEISGLEKKLEENQTRIDKIGSLKAKCQGIQADVTEWEAVREAFAAKGIPALELSLIAPLIDRESNRLLKSNGTRFRTEIITQDLDSTGKRVLEKFKILVHDSRASEVKNLPCLSPGQLGWVSNAVQDAIAIESQKRTGRTWQYCIKDEPDAALDPDAITAFYEMLDLAMDGQRKLLSVSHSPVARELIGNTREITDFMKNYQGGEG